MSSESKRSSQILVAIIVCGCHDAQTVSRAELEEAKSEWQEPKLSIWYYMGSKGGYNYFSHVDLPETKVYRIQEIELILKDRYPITSKRNKWKMMKWGIHSTEERKPQET
jgi:hypothetical protein